MSIKQLTESDVTHRTLCDIVKSYEQKKPRRPLQSEKMWACAINSGRGEWYILTPPFYTRRDLIRDHDASFGPGAWRRARIAGKIKAVRVRIVEVIE